MTDATQTVARAICARGLYDPDEIMANGGPRWRYYVDGAEAATAAHTKHLVENAGEVERRLVTHFDDCPPRNGEKSFTRSLLDEAAATIAALRATNTRMALEQLAAADAGLVDDIKTPVR